MINKKNSKGFTLVELLVVIAIIGILAVVAVPALFKNINKAKVADLEADYNAFKSATLSYYTDKNVYPESANLENSELAEYMESVPEKSPLSASGDYEIKLVTVTQATESNEGKKSLVLIADGNEISEDQAKKMKSELGDVIGLVSGGEGSEIFTPANDDGGNLKGTGQKIGLVLIKNIGTIEALSKSK